jgi:hypothetical protein
MLCGVDRAAVGLPAARRSRPNAVRPAVRIPDLRTGRTLVRHTPAVEPWTHEGDRSGDARDADVAHVVRNDDAGGCHPSAATRRRRQLVDPGAENARPSEYADRPVAGARSSDGHRWSGSRGTCGHATRRRHRRGLHVDGVALTSRRQTHCEGPADADPHDRRHIEGVGPARCAARHVAALSTCDRRSLVASSRGGRGGCTRSRARRGRTRPASSRTARRRRPRATRGR